MHLQNISRVTWEMENPMGYRVWAITDMGHQGRLHLVILYTEMTVMRNAV